MTNNPPVSLLKERIARRLQDLQMTERAASMEATGQPDTIRYIRTRGTLPGLRKMLRLATVLQTSVDYLVGDTNDPAPPAQSSVAEVGKTKDRVAEDQAGFRGGEIEALPLDNSTGINELPGMRDSRQMPRDIPVFGTALGADAEFIGINEGTVAVEQTDLNRAEVIDYLRRPPALLGKPRLYGLYVTGTSMEPVFESGSPIIIDPTRAPSIRDYVVVYIRGAGEEDDADICTSVLVKRLIRRSASFVELEQFNPAASFRLETARIHSMHRILNLTDLLGV